MRKYCILIVEDEKPVAQALCRALNTPQGGGYMVESCESAEIALERLGSARFDLLIADLRLPGMNGLELIEKAHQRSPGMCSILITAFGSPQVEKQARRLADAYVLKPFRLQDMIQLVRCILNEDQQGPKLEQTDRGQLTKSGLRDQRGTLYSNSRGSGESARGAKAATGPAPGRQN